METIHLDTHIVVWLAAGKKNSLKSVTRELEENDLVISPMVLLEMRFLHEIGRLLQTPENIFQYLAKTIGLQISSAPFFLVVQNGLKQAWTSDPFDRLIVGNAIADNSPLITADEKIKENFSKAIHV